MIINIAAITRNATTVSTQLFSFNETESQQAEKILKVVRAWQKQDRVIVGKRRLRAFTDESPVVISFGRKTVYATFGTLDIQL